MLTCALRANINYTMNKKNNTLNETCALFNTCQTLIISIYRYLGHMLIWLIYIKAKIIIESENRPIICVYREKKNYLKELVHNV